MEINKNTGEQITLAQAQEMVNEFRKRYPDTTKGYFAGANHFDKILKQEDCIGLRIYNGYDKESDSTNLVIVGVNSNNEDMTKGYILDKAAACPPNCPKNNDLM
ncbi:MAG: hypothetical protein KA210_00640 [Bacteroidia bacterium]|nr:hypothetical protein [Bacteroidia bacterium]